MFETVAPGALKEEALNPETSKREPPFVNSTRIGIEPLEVPILPKNVGLVLARGAFDL